LGFKVRGSRFEGAQIESCRVEIRGTHPWLGKTKDGYPLFMGGSRFLKLRVGHPPIYVCTARKSWPPQRTTGKTRGGWIGDERMDRRTAGRSEARGRRGARRNRRRGATRPSPCQHPTSHVSESRHGAPIHFGLVRSGPPASVCTPIPDARLLSGYDDESLYPLRLHSCLNFNTDQKPKKVWGCSNAYIIYKIASVNLCRR